MYISIFVHKQGVALHRLLDVISYDHVVFFWGVPLDVGTRTVRPHSTSKLCVDGIETFRLLIKYD